jgi:hypothetical protein
LRFGERIMTEKEKQDRFLLYIPKGQEERFRLYKKIAKELGKSVNDRIWMLIEEDEEKLFSILKTLKEEVKTDESE